MRFAGFVTLHPNSVLALNPDVLRLDDLDIQAVEDGLSVSAKHQMLAYMSLLETTKPYLVNCVRLPTLQFLLMLAGENRWISKIIDGFSIKSLFGHVFVHGMRYDQKFDVH